MAFDVVFVWGHDIWWPWWPWWQWWLWWEKFLPQEEFQWSCPCQEPSAVCCTPCAGLIPRPPGSEGLEGIWGWEGGGGKRQALEGGGEIQRLKTSPSLAALKRSSISPSLMITHCDNLNYHPLLNYIFILIQISILCSDDHSLSILSPPSSTVSMLSSICNLGKLSFTF